MRDSIRILQHTIIKNRTSIRPIFYILYHLLRFSSQLSIISSFLYTLAIPLPKGYTTLVHFQKVSFFKIPLF